MTADADQHLSVSLNGVDNAGKTTQLAWLHRGMPDAHLVGTVDAWDSRWREVAAGDFAHWWFVGSTTAEHVGLMLGSHVTRRAASGSLALEDRGVPMLRAACAATAAIKDGLSPSKALRLVDRLAADFPAAAPRGEVHVLLRRSADSAREAAEALRREPKPASERYAVYQRTLAEILSLQAERGDYHAVLDLGDAPILDVQRTLRSRLADAGVDVQPLPDDVLDRLWMLGGMSERGKSIVGELGHLMPVPGSAHGDRTSRGELGLVLMTTRRLLAHHQPDVRAVHKHLVLLAKILLRADGHDLQDADDVLTAFRERHPAAECAPPELDDLIRRPSDPVLRGQLVDAMDRLLTYLDRLDDNVRTGE